MLPNHVRDGPEPAPFTFGNTARTLPGVRDPGLVNFDFSAADARTIQLALKLLLNYF